MRAHRIGFVAVALLASACSGSDSPTSAEPTPTPVAEATLANVQALIFTPSCTNIGCHDVSAAGHLDLTDGKSFAALVNVGAVQANAAARTKVRVIPGDPANSFLLQKLDGTMQSDEGIPMPWSTSGLADSRIDLIRDWIQAGALNN